MGRNKQVSFPGMEDDDMEDQDMSGSSGSALDESNSNVDEGMDDTNHKVKEKQEIKERLGKNETNAVRKLRTLFLLTLLGVAVASSVLVYLYTKDTEETEFESAYRGHGNKVIEAFQADSLQKMQALESLSTTITSHALEHNMTWPFVKVANSGRLFGPYLRLAEAAYLVLMPIVESRQRAGWESHANSNLDWIEQDLQVAKEEREGSARRDLQYSSEYQVSPYIKNYVGVDTSTGPWLVWWQYAPVIRNRWFVNFNRLAWQGFREQLASVLKGSSTISQAWTYKPGLDMQSTRDFKFTQQLLQAGGSENYVAGEPLSYIDYPVFDNWSSSKKAVAVLSATVFWRSYFTNILPEGVQLVAVIENNQGQSFTYMLDGANAKFLGTGDLHNTRFDHLELSAEYSEPLSNEGGNVDYTGVEIDNELISYFIRVYPSAELEDDYLTENPRMFAGIMLAVFLFCVVLFLLFNWYVERRQRLVLNTAAKSSAVVNSMFPEAVRDRLLNDDENEKKKKGVHFMNTGEADKSSSAPIADFYPDTTILFADLVGFTAWCSEREPVQVFTLLEKLYGSFDKIARRRGVFKVETVGDCYVAVCGLPEPRENHAIIMAKFTRDILLKMNKVVHELEVELGPGTADLAMRFGMHSGAVTAGVVRGQNARFQLFGDTMNTASRMESTGERGRIQISSATAELLRAADKGDWFEPRAEKVMVKGKGEFQTYWLHTTGNGPGTLSIGGMSIPDSNSFDSDEEDLVYFQRNSKHDRLIKWNAELLCKYLKLVVARRKAGRESAAANWNTLSLPLSTVGNTVRDHVSDVIQFPEYQPTGASEDQELEDLDSKISDQVHVFVQRIAAMYNDHPFHNFEHASHMTMSVSKCLSRLVSPDVGTRNKTSECDLHDNTFGLSSDPMMQFAMVFSSIIHDVDHAGVPNYQVAVENSNLVTLYSGKSLLEQNSVDLALGCLMDESFTELRQAIFANEAEMKRFYGLVVNAVIATDLFDAELRSSRNDRWKLAFQECAPEMPEQASQKAMGDRKATVIIEHLMQASDVVHTMQHWLVYCLWNKKLFTEMYQAYKQGRIENDPTPNWYEGEIRFFDGYVIPLARKLGDCGIFGASGDEYLKYAEANREEWMKEGQNVVEEWARSLQTAKGHEEWAPDNNASF